MASTEFSFRIATGGVGGVWYPLGGAISSVINKYVPNTEATAEVTTAAIDNLRLLVTGKVAIAWCYDYHIIQLNQGTLTAVSNKKENVRFLAAFYEQPLHIITREDTGINSIWDLKGKRVSTGAPASGTEEQAIYIFKALGMNIDQDIIRERLGASESAKALKDYKIDAYFWSGAVPTSSVVDLSTTPGMKVKFISLNDSEINTILTRSPGVFHKTKIPKDGYPGLDHDVQTVGITAVLAVMDTFPKDVAYNILKAIFDHKDELVAVWKGATEWTPALAVQRANPDVLQYIHEGAKQYYKEKGVL